MATHRLRAPAPVQVEFDRIATTAQLHATVASPSSKSGAYTGRRSMPGSGKQSLTGTFTGSSFMSRMSSHEADLRHLTMQADTTISEPIAQLRQDAALLDATIALQSQLRRLTKRTMYCELFPWCAGAPIHPAERMRLPVLLPTAGNCFHGVYSSPNAAYQTEFEEAPYMWRCVPSKTMRQCRRCGQPAKCGLDNVWGYSVKANPLGYFCRDAARTPCSTGLSHVSQTSTGFVPETLPTGFRLTREVTFGTRRPMGESFTTVAKGTIVLSKDGRQAPAARLMHLDAGSQRTRNYLDETNEWPHTMQQHERPLVKAKLWPRLAAAKIQRALRAHFGRTRLQSLAAAKWKRLRHWGSMTIQCAWAMHVGRAQFRRRHAMIVLRKWISRKPAVEIQRAIRGHWGRATYRFENERCRQWRNIPKIQAAVRRTQQRSLYISWSLAQNNPLTWQIPDPTRMRLLEQPIANLHAACPHPALTQHAAKRGHGSTCISGVASISGGYLLISALNSPVVGKVAFASPVRSYDTDKSGALTAVGESYLSFPGGASPLRKQRFFGDSDSSPIKVKNLFHVNTSLDNPQWPADITPRGHGGGDGQDAAVRATPRSLTPLTERSFCSSPRSSAGSMTARHTASNREIALSPLSARRSAEIISSPVTKVRNVSPQYRNGTSASLSPIAHESHSVLAESEIKAPRVRLANKLERTDPGENTVYSHALADSGESLPVDRTSDLSHTIGDVLPAQTRGRGQERNKTDLARPLRRQQHAQTLRQMFDEVFRSFSLELHVWVTCIHILARPSAFGED